MLIIEIKPGKKKGKSYCFFPLRLPKPKGTPLPLQPTPKFPDP